MIHLFPSVAFNAFRVMGIPAGDLGTGYSKLRENRFTPTQNGIPRRSE